MRCLVLLALLVGCTDSPESSGPSVTSGVVQMRLPMYVNRRIDILLVVDNTPAMAPYGGTLRANLRGFAEEMRTFDLHLGVITADPADDANLRGTTGLTGNFIADAIGTMPGQRLRNYTGDLADVVERLGDPGTQGAASSPLAAAKRFFEKDATFQRADAYTAIFFITANDLPDESVAPYATAFKALNADSSRIVVAGVFGPGDRLGAFLDQFPNRNARARITDDDWSAASDLLGGLVKTNLGAPCIQGPLLDGDPATPGVQQVCNAWFDYPGGSELLKSCRTAPDGECWRMIPSPACTENAELVDIDHHRLDYPRDTYLTLECLTVR
jgi:hypothetical protein